MPKLTKTVIDNAAGPDLWLWDTEVPGFGARIQGDRKTYVVRYRNTNRTQRKLKIARCCDMTPDKARDLARKVFAQVAEGKDPAADRQEAREAPTIADLRDRYMREWARPFKKARSVEIDEGTWRRYIIPKWETKKVADITKSDVLKLQGEMTDKKAAANHVVALLGKAFNLAEDWGWRPQNSNPCRRLKKYKINERQLILLPEQIAAVDRACDELLAEGEITPQMAGLARLLLITGCRNSEIRAAERHWIDHGRRLLLLPDSKVGQRLIPLPEVAMEVIAWLDEQLGADRRWLIPGKLAGTCMQAPWKAWKRIAARAGVPLESSPHTLRHTVGSAGHAAGLSQKQIQGQLGHKQMSTTERYLHGVMSEQAQIADKVAAVITSGWRKKPEAAEA